jgi:hypothetical protein
MGGLEDLFTQRGGSSFDDEDLYSDPVSAGSTGPWACAFIADAVAAELASITVPGWTGNTVIEARWEPHGVTLPTAGTEGIVFIDDNGDPFVVAWWEG